MLADIAAAFVLLVAGGCARAVAQPLWRRFVHWWHTEGQEPVEFKFMDRLVESMAAKTEDEMLDAGSRRLKKKMEKQYTGTKNAGKVPLYQTTRVFGKPCPEFDEQRQAILEQSTSIEEAQKRLREAEEAAIRARLEEDDDEVWMKIAMQSGASRSEAEKRVEKFHAMRKKS